jgi:hypothetical protein
VRNTERTTREALEAAIVSAVTTATEGFLPSPAATTSLLTADGLLAGSVVSQTA